MRNLDGVLLPGRRSLYRFPQGQWPCFESGPRSGNSDDAFKRSCALWQPHAGITAAGFRALYNERGNTLITTTGPLVENAGSLEQLVFPHIAEGGGYTTQFIVIGGVSGQANSGVLRFFNEQGNPLNVTLADR
jgi:hypothetical protein